MIPRRRTPVTAALALVLLATLVAACGGGSGAAPADDAPNAPTEQAAAAGGEATQPPEDGGAADTPALAALVATDRVQAALGETPTPECDSSVLSESGSCVWTAADGSWLKIELSEPREMPDLESFTSRVTGTLGLDEPVAGLGEAAYLGTSSRGTRIAVYLGEGRVAWVVLNKQGDVSDLVTEIATAMVAEL